MSGTRAERHQVMLFVEPETLAAGGEPGCSELEDTSRVSAETARRRRVVLRDPRGGIHLDVAPEAPALEADPVVALVRENRRRGADPDAYDATARWKRGRDVPQAILFRALEAAL